MSFPTCSAQGDCSCDTHTLVMAKGGVREVGRDAEKVRCGHVTGS